MHKNNLSKVENTININSDKTHIAIIMGGYTEREISLSSARGIIENLKSLGYKITPIDMGKDIGEILSQIKPDIVFNALHGGYGENGALPGLLDIMEIPYTHSGILASSIAMDKIMSKMIFEANDIKTIDHIIVNKGDDIKKISESIKPPYVIKPFDGGSSLGINIVFEGDNFDILDYKFEYGDKVIIEKYIKGRELQVGILRDRAIGVLELKMKGRFFDYAAKYDERYAAEHIMPAKVSQDVYNRALTLAEKAHKLLGCRNISRVEFIYNDEEDELYILEVNTHPGMTPISILPDIAAHSGITYQDILEILIKDALSDKTN